jgi:phosphoribosyl-AMP cyclohydrolase
VRGRTDEGLSASRDRLQRLRLVRHRLTPGLERLTDLSVWVERLRAEEPGALAILLQGSHARGDAGPYSDVDLRVVTAGPPRVRDRAYLLQEGGRLVHYSVGGRPLAELVEAAANPELWPWLVAHYAAVKPIWDPQDVVGLLRRTVEANRPGPRPYVDGLLLELETMVEEVAKVRNAVAADDYLAAARAAWETADQAWKVLLRCTDPWPLRSQREGVERMLRLGEAIPRYRENLLICLGLTPDPRPLDALSRAALQLAEGIVAWLEPRLNDLDQPAVTELLADGKLAAYLRQLRT